MKKRSIAFLLSLVMLLSLLTPTALAEEPDQEGQATEERTEIPALSETTVAVPREAAFGDETTVTAPEGAESYQWQFRLMEGLWVNISGDESAEIVLTYAKVCNMLDESGAASLRCLVDGAASETLTVTVTDEPAQEPGAAEEPDEAPVPDEEPVLDEEPVAQPVLPVLDPQQSAEDTIVSGVIGVQADGNVKTTYNIVINYLFENNAVASDPYTANLAEGSSFNDTVTFPTVQGYLPYVGEEQKNSIELNYPNVSGNVTINVIYKPTNVNYTVIHYQQNVGDDNYTEVERETKQGLTNSPVPEVAKKYDGFYSLLYDRPNIAADGSTVIEVYYDRYYYLMTFDLDGGYGTEPIYARYGAKIGTVTEPTKEGYRFEGWSETKDGTTAVTLPATMPEGNKKYYAIWTANDTAKVTIVFWGENADDEGYSYLSDYTQVIDLKPGTEFTYSESGILICSEEEHTHTSDCGITCGHVHDAACYGGTQQEDPVDGKTDSANENIAQFKSLTGGKLENGMVYRVKCDGAWSTDPYDKYYLYYNNTWYLVSSKDISGSAVATSKKVNAHGHSWNSDNKKDQFWVYNAKLSCGHHTDSCYSCGKKAHTHNSDCYMNGAGLDSKLWKFVKSDTITVAADGSSVVNVYYDRTPFTLTFKSGRDTVKTITDKWGADIHDQFPIKNGEDTIWWKVPEGCTSMEPGAQFGSLDTMPAENITFTYYNKTQQATLHYYVETLPGEDGKTASDIYRGFTSNNYPIIDASKKFKSYKDINITRNGYLTYTEEFHDIVGFRQYVSYPEFNKHELGGRTDGIAKDNYLLYARNSFGIEFFNPTEKLRTVDKIPYQMPLKNYYWEPTEEMAPAQYEPGSVKFGGWYLNPDCTGKQFDFNTATMPAGPTNSDGEVALALYAKWVPVTHEVKFSLDKAAYEAGTLLDSHPTQTVSHGGKLENVADPENGNYTFVGWFYEENGVEKAFDFANMEIRKDLHVYGKWSSNTLIKYIVRYVTADGTPVAGEEQGYIDIADETTGSGLAGTTKTFEAKGGDELYEAYREGYYPTAQSQSVLLDINAEDKQVTVTFVYVPATIVPYAVNYVTEEKPDDGKTYETIEIGGKTYYKLLPSYTNQENRKAVVTETFKVVSGYMPDAYQKRLVVSVDENGNPATEKNVINFIYSKDNLHAYYKITHYIQNTDGTTWRIHAESEAIGDIGKTYSADPMTIPGFTYDPNVKETVLSGELTANGLELKLYYTRNSYPYQVRYLEEGTGKVLHDPTNGSGKYGQVISATAIEISGYEVVGEETKTLSIKIEEDSEAKLNVITFYYKLALADLTITKTGCADIDENQSFIFTVTGDPNDKNTKGYYQKVVVKGNTSVTIKDLEVGSYIVTEDTGWSWRYVVTNNGGSDSKNVDVTVTNGSKVNTVSFENYRKEDKWLNGCSWAENNWASGKKKTDKNPDGETN